MTTTTTPVQQSGPLIFPFESNSPCDDSPTIVSDVASPSSNSNDDGVSFEHIVPSTQVTEPTPSGDELTTTSLKPTNTASSDRVGEPQSMLEYTMSKVVNSDAVYTLRDVKGRTTSTLRPIRFVRSEKSETRSLLIFQSVKRLPAFIWEFEIVRYIPNYAFLIILLLMLNLLLAASLGYLVPLFYAFGIPLHIHDYLTDLFLLIHYLVSPVSRFIASPRFMIFTIPFMIWYARRSRTVTEFVQADVVAVASLVSSTNMAVGYDNISTQCINVRSRMSGASQDIGIMFNDKWQARRPQSEATVAMFILKSSLQEEMKIRKMLGF
jgi:hypothetical protein